MSTSASGAAPSASASTDSDRKEEFQRYLEKSGVIDSLTRVLVGLYQTPEKPTNAVKFVKEFLGSAENTSGVSAADATGATSDTATLMAQLAAKDAEIVQLKQELEQLRARQSVAASDALTGEAAASTEPAAVSQ